MGAGYFIIAILGCADGSASCAQVATLPVRYSTQAQCAASVNAALIENSNFDFPTVMAECRAVSEPMSTRGNRPLIVPASVRRG